MQMAEIRKLMSSTDELSPFISYFEEVAKPSVEIVIGRRWPGATKSRLGGSPAVSSDFVWPTPGTGRYCFLGQINFGEIDDKSGQLPHSGLLSLFFADWEGADAYWRESGYVIAYYWHATDGLDLLDIPKPHAPYSRRIKFKTGVDIPRWAELRGDWPINEDTHDAFGEVVLNSLPQDHLLGYPSFYTLGYDPTPGPDWTLLLAIDCHEEVGLYWDGSRKLMVFIERDRLASRDFSNLKCDIG